MLENGVFPKEVNWVVFRNKGIWATRRREEGTGNILPKRELRGQFYLLYIFSKLMLWKTLLNSQSIFIASSLNTWNLVKLSKRNLPVMLCNAAWTTLKSCVPLNVNSYTQIPKSYMRQIKVYPEIQTIFTEWLQYAQHICRCWEYLREQLQLPLTSRGSCSMGRR